MSQAQAPSTSTRCAWCGNGIPVDTGRTCPDRAATPSCADRLAAREAQDFHGLELHDADSDHPYVIDTRWKADPQWAARVGVSIPRAGSSAAMDAWNACLADRQAVRRLAEAREALAIAEQHVEETRAARMVAIDRML